MDRPAQGAETVRARERTVICGLLPDQPALHGFSPKSATSGRA
jgi:hypothetical protein